MSTKRRAADGCLNKIPELLANGRRVVVVFPRAEWRERTAGLRFLPRLRVIASVGEWRQMTQDDWRRLLAPEDGGCPALQGLETLDAVSQESLLAALRAGPRAGLLSHFGTDPAALVQADVLSADLLCELSDDAVPAPDVPSDVLERAFATVAGVPAAALLDALRDVLVREGYPVCRKRWFHEQFLRAAKAQLAPRAWQRLPPDVAAWLVASPRGPMIPAVVAAPAPGNADADAWGRLRRENRRWCDELTCRMNIPALDVALPRAVRLVAHSSSSDEGERLLALVQDGRSFVLFGGAAEGKSVEMLVLACRLAERWSPGDVGAPLPVFVRATELADAVPRDASRADAVRLLRDALVSRLWAACASPSDARPLATVLRDRRLRLALLVDGFDELVVRDPDVVVRPALVQALVALRDVAPDGSLENLVIGVASRPSERALLEALEPARHLELVALSEAVVERYLREHWPALGPRDDAFREIARFFSTHLGGKPLYLLYLCHYVSDRGELPRAAFVDLLAHVTERSIEKSPLPEDPLGRVQRACLRRLALRLLEAPGLTEADMRGVAEESRSEAADAPSVETLVRVVHRHLNPVGVDLPSVTRADTAGRLEFAHLSLRDYWVANAVCDWLATGREARPDVVRAVLHGAAGGDDYETSVLKLTSDLARGIASAEPRLRDVLVASARSEGRGGPPGDRKLATAAAAALSLLVRLHPSVDVDVSGLSLQRFDGRDCNLERVAFRGAFLGEADLREADLHAADLAGASLNNADLRGANLDGADLRRASLRNARLGGLRVERGKERFRPTSLRGAALEDSNWFNVRIELPGLPQLWEAREVADEVSGGRILFFASSRGALLRRFRPEGGVDWCSLPPLALEENDLLDVDVDVGGQQILTASRTRWVRLLALDDGWTEAERPLAALKLADDYPRRAAFGRSGATVCVVDRAAETRVYEREALLSGDTRPVARFAEHRGPVVCLLATQGPQDTDVFFTAGYDGRILTVKAPRRGARAWRCELVADVGALVDGDSDDARTVRALALSPRAATSPGTSRLWIGTEDGSVLSVDPLAPQPAPAVAARLRDPAAGKPRPVFALAHHGEEPLLAVGDAFGRVTLHAYDRDAPTPVLHEVASHQMPCGDIVRSLAWRAVDRDWLILTWAGTVHLWSPTSRRTTAVLAPDEGEWDALQGLRALRLAGSHGPIEGLSSPFLRYLEMVRNLDVDS